LVKRNVFSYQQKEMDTNKRNRMSPVLYGGSSITTQIFLLKEEEMVLKLY